MFDYDYVFTSFNITFNIDVGTSGIEHMVLENDEDSGFSPRSSVPNYEENCVSTEAEVPSSGATAEQNSELITPIENAMSQGEIGSNLETDMPVDTVVTTRANRDHPVDHIIGDSNAGVTTRSRVSNTSLFVAIKEIGESGSRRRAAPPRKIAERVVRSRRKAKIGRASC